MSKIGRILKGRRSEAVTTSWSFGCPSRRVMTVDLVPPPLNEIVMELCRATTPAACAGAGMKNNTARTNLVLDTILTPLQMVQGIRDQLSITLRIAVAND